MSQAEYAILLVAITLIWKSIDIYTIKKLIEYLEKAKEEVKA